MIGSHNLVEDELVTLLQTAYGASKFWVDKERWLLRAHDDPAHPDGLLNEQYQCTLCARYSCGL